MDIKLQHVNLDYVEEIAGGDNSFKKELIQIFLGQIPDFVVNMEKYLAEDNRDELAKEAHTAKSSVLIFRMEETGNLLKKIQLCAENDEIGSIPELMNLVKSDLKSASEELTEILTEL